MALLSPDEVNRHLAAFSCGNVASGMEIATHIAELTRDLEAARAERDALQIEIGAANNDIAVFKDRYAELEGNYGYIVAKLDTQAHDLAKAKAEIAGLQRRIATAFDLNHDLATQEDRNDALKRENERLTEALRDGREFAHACAFQVQLPLDTRFKERARIWLSLIRTTIEEREALADKA